MTGKARTALARPVPAKPAIAKPAIAKPSLAKTALKKASLKKPVLQKSPVGTASPRKAPFKPTPLKPWPDTGPELDALVTDVIGRVADKWTMLVLEVLADHGDLRFTQISRLVPEVSQKMLTQTLRQMERDGLVTRTIFPVIPPRVEYRLTDLGLSLGAAFCGVWTWAEKNLRRIQAARAAFDAKASA